MKKNGFTLVELLAVIVVLAVLILIATTAVIPQMKKSQKNNFANEALLIMKDGAEAAFIDNQLKGVNKTCYTFDELNGTYITKDSAQYYGKFVLTVNSDGDITDKKIFLTDKKNFMITDRTPSQVNNNIDEYVVEYNASVWSSSNEVC